MPDHLPDCPCCGGTLSPVDFAVRSTWPDPMLALSPEDRDATWGNEHLRAAADLGAFVRCLMPVRLTGGGTLEYSVWLRVPAAMVRHASEIWETPEYADLRLEGTVANAIQPWTDMLGAPARAEVRDPESIPYLVADEGTLMHRVLHDEWDRDDVLSRLTYALPTPVRQRITTRWSLDRSAGLELRRHQDRIFFGGPGRTVHLDPLGTPADAAPADMIRDLTADSPPDRDGELTETDEQVHRYAFWRPALGDGRIVHNLHGYVAVPGDLLHLVCVYDDPADLAWAQRTWRSVRPEAGIQPPPC
ncbi:hypothetical protein DMB66_40235 [Actinoplanes sp. ATCC 53533]|uniref:DUF2199 domain-containing protein n=1 Tax=Actinoplanes sp. ATCC 53533 TaxID=1288362 RepID=UPI000F7A2B51|nr:DUF2199 domain-containing protein [Actinoplanes sp. ATCC 53533]RSM52417.1 hypothetical protein DMB66_40235 [Actinoplanes sp. ATCC 53533]